MMINNYYYIIFMESPSFICNNLWKKCIKECTYLPLEQLHCAPDGVFTHSASGSRDVHSTFSS